MRITSSGPYFRDEFNRVVLLRGVNLGGSTKVPFTPNGASWNRDTKTFYNHKEVSFVGRPFPLEEADEHFGRLRDWGFTFLRFLVTWEAIEHAGPGIYDMEYLQYVRRILEKAHQYGFLIYIDPHQDVWSRWTGGDGAPGWVFEAVGIDVTKIDAVGGALCEQTYHKDKSFPCMIWPTNYFKFACATMFTLFYAGRDLAPKTMIEGVNVQDYLQDHYCKAICALATELRGLPNIVGYGSMNEPSMGWIGLANCDTYPWELKYGDCPTPYQAMCLASGVPTKIPFYEFKMFGFKCTQNRLTNPKGISVWKKGTPSVWEQNGVFSINPATGIPQLLRPNHFSVSAVTDKPLDFYADCMVPFLERFTQAVHSVAPEALIFVESCTMSNYGVPMHLGWKGKAPEKTVYADHWYDGLPLFTKTFRKWLYYDNETQKMSVGFGAAQRGRMEGVARISRRAKQYNMPPLVGECGIAYDMGGKNAYKSGNFSLQESAFDCSLQALEENLVSFTLWNYTSDNSNQYGDHWNGEDLSIFSRDQLNQQSKKENGHQKGLAVANSAAGGRALNAVVRPYAMLVAGLPQKQKFNKNSKEYVFSFVDDLQASSSAANAPTEFFVPKLQYPNGYRVTVSDGRYEIDAQHQRLRWFTEKGGATTEHTLKIVDPVVMRRRMVTFLAIQIGVLVVGVMAWLYLSSSRQ